MITVEAITVEMITVETITVEAISSSVGPGGGELTPSRHSMHSTGWPLVIFKIRQFKDV